MCDRIGIMDHDKSIALGTLEQLRAKYGKALAIKQLTLGVSVLPHSRTSKRLP